MSPLTRSTGKNWVAEAQREKQRDAARRRLLEQREGREGKGVSLNRDEEDHKDADSDEASICTIGREEVTEAEAGKGGGDPMKLGQAKLQKHKMPVKAKRVARFHSPAVRSSASALRPIASFSASVSATVKNVKLGETEDAKRVLTGWQEIAQRIVNYRAFELITCLVVATSTLVGAIEVDHNDGQVAFFDRFNLAVTVIFTFELIMRSLVETSSACCQALYLLDFLLVVLSWLHLLLFRDVDAEGNQWIMPCVFVLRLFRLLKITLRAPGLPFQGALEVIVTACQKSIEPLFFVTILITIFLFAMALMLVSLVPVVAEEASEMKYILVDHYRSVGYASLSLVEAMLGVGNWLLDVAIPLLDAAGRGSLAAGVFLVLLVLCIAMLHLGLTGLVTGVFLDHIFGASLDVQEAVEMAETDNRRKYLHDIDLVFPQDEFPRDEMVEWSKLKSIITKGDKEGAHDRLLLLDRTLGELKEVFDTLLAKKRKDMALPHVGEVIHALLERKHFEKDEEGMHERMTYMNSILKVFPPHTFPSHQAISLKEVMDAVEKDHRNIEFLDMSYANLEDLYTKLRTEQVENQKKVRMEDFERALYNDKNYSSNVDMILVDDQQRRCHQGVKKLENKILTRVGGAQSKLSNFAVRLESMTKRLTSIGEKLDRFRTLEKEWTQMEQDRNILLSRAMTDETKLKQNAAIEEQKLDVMLNDKLRQIEHSLSRCDALRAQKPTADISPRLKQEATEKVAKEIVESFRDVLIDIIQQDFMAAASASKSNCEMPQPACVAHCLNTQEPNSLCSSSCIEP